MVKAKSTSSPAAVSSAKVGTGLNLSTPTSGKCLASSGVNLSNAPWTRPFGRCPTSKRMNIGRPSFQATPGDIRRPRTPMGRFGSAQGRSCTRLNWPPGLRCFWPDNLCGAFSWMMASCMRILTGDFLWVTAASGPRNLCMRAICSFGVTPCIPFVTGFTNGLVGSMRSGATCCFLRLGRWLIGLGFAQSQQWGHPSMAMSTRIHCGFVARKVWAGGMARGPSCQRMCAWMFSKHAQLTENCLPCRVGVG